ncbi:MAG: hypothetical protein ACOYXT_04205 [Bacteroidota bacterium]
MKISKITLITALVLTTVISVTAKDGVEPVPTRYKNLFVFKTERKFVGAKVEVLYSNGDVITVQTLQKRKMIIDFCDVKHGAYTVRVTKGNNVKEFKYVKK